MNQPTALLQAALSVVRSGISVIPVATDKTPRADLLPPKDQHSTTWRPYRERLPTADEVTYWHQHGAQFAMVCGALGDLIAIDFDDAEFYHQFVKVADVSGCVIQRSGGRGYHLLFRTKLHVKPEGLAYVPADNVAKRSVVIETRGVGNVIGMAPSLHHSGRYYEVISGDLGSIPYLDDATVQTLLATARAMTQVEVPVFQPSPRVQRPYLNGDASVIDTFNQRYTIRDELEAAGYVPRTARGYVRPGGQNPTVEVYDETNTAFHFNTNDPLFGATDPFKVWMHARGHHDFTSAVREAANLLDMKPKPSLTPPITTPQPQTMPFHPTLTDASLTDFGNAECLAALYSDRLRYCRNNQQWFWWDGQRWQKDAESPTFMLFIEAMELRMYASAHLPDPDKANKLFSFAYRTRNKRGYKPALDTAALLPTFNTTINDYDRDIWLLGLENGVLDLRTQTMRPAEPDDMITMQANVAYDASAKCPRWRQFLIEVFNNDTELIRYMQRVVGYGLTGDRREQKMFLLFGDGNNGKSVFIETIRYLLGDYGATSPSSTFDGNRREGDPTNDIAMLYRKRFTAISETNVDNRLNEGLVKRCTGDEEVSCRFLRQEFFSYVPTWLVFMGTNHLPLIRNTDNGIWRRLVPIPFTQNFDGREDRTLSRTLKQEASGILNWALEGLKDWLQNGLGTAQAINDSKKTYRSNSDIIGQFLDEKYIIANEPDDWQTANKLYKEFQDWSLARGEKPMTVTSFGRILGGKGFISERRVVGTSKVTVYLGLRERTTTDD